MRYSRQHVLRLLRAGARRFVGAAPLVPLLLAAMPSRADTRARPDLDTVEPVAACALQPLAELPQAMPPRPVVGLYPAQPPVDDLLANYERTPLGTWPQIAEADRSDPWLRLLLLAPRQPLVIDLAVFIDGQAFRAARAAWVDQVLNNARDEEAGGAPPAAKRPSEAGGDVDTGDRPPGLAAQARQAPTMRQRLERYLAAAGPVVSRQEVDWLIAEWGSGPAVVVLNRAHSWQRAGLAPLLAHLDQDGDGALSAHEIDQAEARLRSADRDGNGVVELRELRQVAMPRLVSPSVAGHPLLVLVDANTDREMLAASLARVYDSDAADRLPAVFTRPADVVLRADFRRSAEPVSLPAPGVSLLGVAAGLSAEGAPTATDDTVVWDIAGGYVEFSAAHSPAAERSGDAAQLAVGAVIDGRPLWRLLDRDQDGRLTLREMRELPGLLAALDRDDDGRLTAAELPVPIRLAVTLGPHVHRLMATPTSAARRIAPRDALKAPDWFASMDQNNDGFLSPSEFLGTPQQFQQLDTDGDGLLSIEEALRLDAGRPEP